jgi:hypothetical protein
MGGSLWTIIIFLLCIIYILHVSRKKKPKYFIFWTWSINKMVFLLKNDLQHIFIHFFNVSNRRRSRYNNNNMLHEFIKLLFRSLYLKKDQAAIWNRRNFLSSIYIGGSSPYMFIGRMHYAIFNQAQFFGHCNVQ